VADPEFGCMKIGSLENNKLGIKYILQILFNPSGGIYPLYTWIRTWLIDSEKYNYQLKNYFSFNWFIKKWKNIKNKLSR